MTGVGHAFSRVQAEPWTARADWRLPVEHLRFRYIGGLAVLVALYYGAAQLGYALGFAGPVASIVWLPVGVGISFLYLFGLEFWPAVVVGDLLSNNYMTLPFGSALGQTCGNLLEVVVATVLIHRLVRRGQPLATAGGVGRVVFALVVGTAVSATIGSLSLRLGHVISTDSLPKVWRTWWLGDACGALLVVPLAIAWYRPTHPNLFRSRRLEAVLGFAALIGLSALGLHLDRSLAYIVFPALTWAALRLRLRGATLGVAVAAAFAVWATTHYAGPFHYHSITRSVLETQLFIAVASFSMLCLAAVVTERERFAARLISSRARLVGAADTERRRLQHDIHDGAQQRITALMVRLRLAEEQARKEPGRTEALIERAEDELQGVIDDLRELVHGRHPRILAEQGLGAAIEDMAANAPIPIKLIEVPATRLPETTETTAYYVLAEAVTNAQKHGMASSIHVRAYVSHRMLHVSVVDDGAGGAAESEGSGLLGLRDRVEALGGAFEVDTIIGHGTLVTAEIPTRPFEA